MWQPYMFVPLLVNTFEQSSEREIRAHEILLKGTEYKKIVYTFTIDPVQNQVRRPNRLLGCVAGKLSPVFFVLSGLVSRVSNPNDF